ncbi:putative DNA-binding domain-containing protein [Poseidonibacter lekithochrous]|uniref:HvfC/BufC family peptide modification chaperone n=1 Tax=Poseidonibacter TaxID=2321187 RepID=UPI001C09BB93|nr:MULTISPECIES: putative DNA-binding domain-containing protein [Poseidonibacter]MBU3014326.1 putative DNA-binding domain-containing protein [Poseidonibacter lekithochrous]MDO6827624.1 putative DNA-binding domain-containing protein [Poseidonibacter sp. 1_MG-2023]
MANNIERDVQNRFFDIISDQKNNPNNSAYSVYQKLVFNRYEEIVKSTFIEFSKYVSEHELEKSIYEFLKNPPSTPFVWQIANDYRKFVKKQKLFHNRKYLYELLYFDWIEVEIYMKEYKKIKKSKFSWDNSYLLAPWSRIKKCNFDIINKNHETKRENFLIIYYDYKSDDVLFREINQFIYTLIKKANKKESISKTLESLCKENEIDFNEAKEILYEPLKELLLSKAICN